MTSGEDEAFRFTTIYEVKFRWCSDISTWGLYSLIETARDAVRREVMPRYESQWTPAHRATGQWSLGDGDEWWFFDYRAIWIERRTLITDPPQG